MVNKKNKRAIQSMDKREDFKIRNVSIKLIDIGKNYRKKEQGLDESFVKKDIQDQLNIHYKHTVNLENSAETSIVNNKKVNNENN